MEYISIMHCNLPKGYQCQTLHSGDSVADQVGQCGSITCPDHKHVLNILASYLFHSFLIESVPLICMLINRHRYLKFRDDIIRLLNFGHHMMLRHYDIFPSEKTPKLTNQEHHYYCKHLVQYGSPQLDSIPSKIISTLNLYMSKCIIRLCFP